MITPVFANRNQALRRGAISVLAAFMSIMVLGMVAFAVDMGYVLANKQELLVFITPKSTVMRSESCDG